jgi:hypothetical protein
MSESIPDVVLRLARRHIPADAAIPISPARPVIEPPEPPIDAPIPLPREQDDESANERSVATQPEPWPANDSHDYESVAAASNRHALVADSLDSKSLDRPGGRSDEHMETADRRPQFAEQAWRRPTAGETPAPQSVTTVPADDPPPTASDAESFADAEPTFERPRAQTPSFPAGSGPPHKLLDPADDAFQPAARARTTTSSSQHDQSPVDSVNETSRQLEQTARDLETALTHLFTTQIETLQHLRDRVDEQERRWVEQQAARRATL